MDELTISDVDSHVIGASRTDPEKQQIAGLQILNSDPAQRRPVLL
jgi:hypothetical protein